MILSAEQAAAVAARHGLNERFGRELLVGHDAAHAEALAAATAATRGFAESAPASKSDRNRALLRSLGMLSEPDSRSLEEGLDFGGGVRAPAPMPKTTEEIERDHGELAVALLVGQLDGGAG